jgi:hypothetical protein
MHSVPDRAKVPKEVAGPKILFKRFKDGVKEACGLTPICSAAAFQEEVPVGLRHSIVTGVLDGEPWPPINDVREEVMNLENGNAPLLHSTPDFGASAAGPAKPAPQWEPLSLPPIAPAIPRVTHHALQTARDWPRSYDKEEAQFVLKEANGKVGSDANAQERAEAILEAAQRTRTPASALDFFLNTPILAMIKNESVANALIDTVQKAAVEHAEDAARGVTKSRDERLAYLNAEVGEAQDSIVDPDGLAYLHTQDLARKLNAAVGKASESSCQAAIKKVLSEEGYGGPHGSDLDRLRHTQLFRQNVLDPRTLARVVEYLANEGQARVAA